MLAMCPSFLPPKQAQWAINIHREKGEEKREREERARPETRLSLPCHLACLQKMSAHPVPILQQCGGREERVQSSSPSSFHPGSRDMACMVGTVVKGAKRH